MHQNEQIEILKRVMSGERPTIGAAKGDEVVATVKTAFNPQTRSLGIDVVLEAKPGIHIENHMASVGYVIAGGKGQDRVYSARSWGVGEGPMFRAGVDLTVTDSGVRRGVWRVGTFVKTSEGYRMWSQSGEFAIEASAAAELAEHA